MEETITRAQVALARMTTTIAEMQRIVDAREWADTPTAPMPAEMLEQIRGGGCGKLGTD